MIYSHIPEEEEFLEENKERNPIKMPILDSYGKMPEPYKDQIELDIKRTFVDEKDFILDK